MLLTALFGVGSIALAQTVTPPPHGMPAIRSYQLSERVVHSFDTVRGHVETSPNVGYVEARITNYAVAMTRDGVGRFSLSYKVPWIPFWLHRAYTLQIVARSVDGVEVKEYIPIQLR
jgi:hypothetical protein